jgi:ubiquitin-conjugating enzyme E2 G1
MLHAAAACLLPACCCPPLADAACRRRRRTLPMLSHRLLRPLLPQRPMAHEKALAAARCSLLTAPLSLSLSLVVVVGLRRVMADGSQAALLLAKQLRDLNKNPVEGFSAGLVDDSNIFEWEIMIIGPTDTPYEGGFFKARMTFPKEYPNLPPKLTFTSKFYHPNVYEDGRVCISILHSPGEDQMSGESSGERWLPIHTVESILISVISMISSPNPDSPANVDAAKIFREDPATFRKEVARCVRRSQEE